MASKLTCFDISCVLDIQQPLPTHPAPWSLGLPSGADPHPCGGHKAWSGQPGHPAFLLAFVMSSGVGPGPKPKTFHQL